MSAPAKTSDAAIREGARRLLELHGVEGLSMAAVAAEVGVRAPSLYKRFASRGELLGAVTGDALAELQGLMERAVRPGKPRASLERMARWYRVFAKKNPRAYGLIFSPDIDVALEARMASAGALLAVLTEGIGAEKALPAARLLVAFVHGFVSMELEGMFQFGGSVDEAFEFGLATILDGLF